MVTGARTITTDGNLFSFFYDRVHAARMNQRAPVSDETEFYLVSLLVGFLHSGRLFRPDDRDEDRVPLAIRLRRAQAGEAKDPVRELRHVGDYALYIAGFFAESLRRRLVDVDYYVAVGGSAYRSVARALSFRGGEPGLPYGELSTRFPECVDVLAEVADSTRGTDARAMLALYERWLSSQSETTRRRLVELGVLLPPAAAGPTPRDQAH